MTITTAPYWKAGVDWMTQNLFDTIEAVRVFLLLYFLNPLRAFFEALPWAGVLLILAALGWRIGGAGLAVLVGLLGFFAAATGLWVPAMQTLYLALGVAQRSRLRHRDADHRHATDHPVLLLHHPRCHALPRR